MCLVSGKLADPGGTASCPARELCMHSSCSRAGAEPLYRDSNTANGGQIQVGVRVRQRCGNAETCVRVRVQIRDMCGAIRGKIEQEKIAAMRGNVHKLFAWLQI